LASLPKVKSEDDLIMIINRIFVKWFGLETIEPHSKDIEYACRILEIKVSIEQSSKAAGMRGYRLLAGTN
jgi:hypothetical protein